MQKHLELQNQEENPPNQIASYETIKILSQWEALEKKVKQHHLPIRGPHWERHWRPGPVNSNNQSNLKKEHRNPPTVRSTSKFKTEGPRKNTPSLGKTFKFINTNQTEPAEEAEQPPPNSAYPIISDAMAKAVSISLIVHRLSFFVFVCNKLSLNDLCSL